MATPKVLSVGQCGVDHPAIRRLLKREFDADVVPADSTDEAFAQLGRQPFDLVLANRVFDAGGSGLEFIGEMKADQALKDVPVMLVSDLPEAQRQAVQLGAISGFGKAALHRSETVERIAAVLEKGNAERAG